MKTLTTNPLSPRAPRPCLSPPPTSSAPPCHRPAPVLLHCAAGSSPPAPLPSLSTVPSAPPLLPYSPPWGGPLHRSLSPFPIWSGRDDVAIQREGSMQPSSYGGSAGLTRPPNGQTGEDQCGDPALPALTAVLRIAGAGECLHKHGTFLAHLLEVYRMLRLWAAPDTVARCGLYHSAYSNFYVNLAIFEPDVGRGRVAAVVGDEAERFAHLFCVIPRQQLIHDDLLFHYDDADLARSEESLLDARHGVFHDDEPWRRKIQRLLPADGITVKHIRVWKH